MDLENVKLKSGKFNLDIKSSLSPLFSVAKIYVMYLGKNPNGSIFEKDVIMRNIESIKNIPIVGEYFREKDNFGDHGGDITVEDDEISFIETTSPIGLVPENAVFKWESVVDKYGEEREYLVVENAYIWNRDKKMTKALKESSFGQSMEIQVTDSAYREDGFMEIKDFFFKALCILGIDRDGVGRVKPAFDDARIITYSSSDENERFSSDLKDMFEDFKFALSDIQNKVKEDTKLDLKSLLEKYSITESELSEKLPNYQDMEIEEIESKLSDEKDEEVAETTEVAEITDTDEVDEVVSDEADEEDKANGVDQSDNESETEDTAETEEVEVEVEAVDEKTIVEDNTDEYESRIKELELENEKLNEKITDLEEAVGQYKKENHNRECQAIVEEFSSLYSIDKDALEVIDFADFKNVESLEAKLFEIVGRMSKKNKFSKDEKEQKHKIYNFDLDLELDKETNNYSFVELFEKK